MSGRQAMADAWYPERGYVRPASLGTRPHWRPPNRQLPYTVTTEMSICERCFEIVDAGDGIVTHYPVGGYPPSEPTDILTHRELVWVGGLVTGGYVGGCPRDRDHWVPRAD